MLASGQSQRDLAEATQCWDTQELGRDFVVHGFMAAGICPHCHTPTGHPARDYWGRPINRTEQQVPPVKVAKHT
jgi:hypothetical protein